MTSDTTTPVRVAVLDLYDNEPNEGMRCIRELLTLADGRYFGQPVVFDVFETRYKNELPGLDYDVYLSSGGPGSPFDGIGKTWEARYFEWLNAAWEHNQRADGDRKHILFICHSFQMMCRFFEVAEVTRRRSISFGIFPVHQTAAGKRDVLFEGLANPFYAADFRNWQAVQPRLQRLDELGASVLALEKIRPHVPLERALMAIRLSPEIAGVQFHPEADPPGMALHFRHPTREQATVRDHGPEKYARILKRLEDPAFLKPTHDHVIPNFLRNAVALLRPEAVTTVP